MLCKSPRRLLEISWRSDDTGRERASEKDEAMDLQETFTKPLKDFAKNSIRLVKRCTKPDSKGKRETSEAGDGEPESCPRAGEEWDVTSASHPSDPLAALEANGGDFRPRRAP